jgi:phosphate transport system permease protein
VPRLASRSDRLFYYSLIPFAATVVAVLVLLFAAISYASAPALRRYGLKILASSVWRPSEVNPSESDYGLLAPLYGTLVSSLIAAILALPTTLAVVLALEEYAPRSVRDILASIVEVMAGIPTIVYGLWGVEVLAPLLKHAVYDPLHSLLGFIPLFSCKPLSPYNIATAGVLLAIMILPYMVAVVREAYRSIPFTYREAILALGATRYEYAKLMFSLAKPGVIAALLLGFGRAAGETVAVALVVGNSFNMSPCLFKPGYTISALIANQFSMAPLYPYMMSVLFTGGLILLIIGLAANTLGVIMLERGRRMLA